MPELDKTYLKLTQPSSDNDIWMHLPMLTWLASESRERIVELGTRFGRSTYAIGVGVSEGIKFDSVDIREPYGFALSVPSIHKMTEFHQRDSRESFGGLWDLLFIDTEHNYSQMKSELSA